MCKKILKKKKLKCNLENGNFVNTPYKSRYFDSVIDVFSSCCLDRANGKLFLKEVNRILKKNGKFFSYFPSKRSDMFKNPTVKKLDPDTLKSIKSKTAINIDCALRFMSPTQYASLLKKNGFKVTYLETLMKTYHFQKEKFFFVIIEASKIK